MSLQPYKIAIKWGEAIIEIPITEQQQELFAKQAFALVHGDTEDNENPLDESLEFLTKEEEHLRKLLLQAHQNRRILEEQKSMSVNDTSLQLMNNLSKIMDEIKELNKKINYIRRRVRQITGR